MTTLRPVGVVESTLGPASGGPLQGDEGAPDAWVVLDAAFEPAGRDIAVGDHLVVLTWLGAADRSVLRVHPRGDVTRPERGVFSTRSQHRPNPIGIHHVEVLAVDGLRLRVRGLEAWDGTPVVDIKSELEARGAR